MLHGIRKDYDRLVCGSFHVSCSWVAIAVQVSWLHRKIVTAEENTFLSWTPFEEMGGGRQQKQTSLSVTEGGGHRLSARGKWQGNDWEARLFSEQARKTKLTPEPSSSPSATPPFWTPGCRCWPCHFLIWEVDQLLSLSVLQFPQLFSCLRQGFM